MEAYQALCEALRAANPPLRPVGLLAHALNGLNAMQKMMELVTVLDVLLKEQAVHLAVDVLYGYLEAIESPHFWQLHIYKHRHASDT